MNTSTRPVYEKGVLVRTKQFYRTGIVEAHRNNDIGKVQCQVRFWSHITDNAVHWIDEADLRAQTFTEFASFIHPQTHGWMVGKTRGYMAAIIHLLALALIGVSLATWGDGPTWTAAVLGVAIIAGFWWGTWNNFTGRWK